jgi:DNA-binding transcriptional LysR family regulator
MRFDLTDLRLFVAINEAGSISGGAEKANLALASASARVSGMELALGVPLLERGRRGIKPTPAGRTLLQHARAVGAQVERMRGDLRAFSTGLRGEIRLLSNTAALVELLPAALRNFLATNPGVDVDLEECTSDEILVAIATGSAEVGVVAESAGRADVETLPIALDRLVALIPAAHPLAGRAGLAFEDLLDEPFVGLREGALQSHLSGHTARLGRRINYRVRLGSFDAIARIVGAGAGVAVLPLAAASRSQTDGVALVPLTDDWAQRRLLVCARNFDGLSLHARRLVDEIIEAAGSALGGIASAAPMSELRET